MRLARFARGSLLRHALPISLLILRKKPTVLQSSKFNIYHKNPLLSQALALYTTKQGKQGANSFISFNTLAFPGGHWQQRFFGQRNFQKMGVVVSLLGMVPVDHSVKNYRSTEKMKDKLLPLDKSHVQRVVKDKNPIPRDARNARKAVECHRG